MSKVKLKFLPILLLPSFQKFVLFYWSLFLWLAPLCIQWYKPGFPLLSPHLICPCIPLSLSLNISWICPLLSSSGFISYHSFLFFCLGSPDLSVLGSFLLQSPCYSLPPMLIFPSNHVFLREAFLTEFDLCNTDVYIAVYLPSKQLSPVKFYVYVTVWLIPAFLEPTLNFIRARGVHSVHFFILCIWHIPCIYWVCVHWTN